VRTLRLAAGLAALVLAGLPALAAPASAAPETTVSLRVMTLNIFYGGDEIDLHTGSWCHRKAGCPETRAQVVEAIRASGADIVGLEEGEHSTTLIADALGWYASERTQVISRYPIIDPPGGDGRYAFIEIAPGEVVAIQNVHLPSNPYGPSRVRMGESRAEVLERERTLRLPVIQTYLETGLVPRFPTAILSTGLMLMAALSFFAGLILATVTQGRRELKALFYLQQGSRAGARWREPGR